MELHCYLCEVCDTLLLELHEKDWPLCCGAYMANFSPVISDNLRHPAPLHCGHRRAGTESCPADECSLWGCRRQSKTDREFLRGTENGRQFEGQDWVGDKYRRMAHRRQESIEKARSTSQDLPSTPATPTPGSAEEGTCNDAANRRAGAARARSMFLSVLSRNARVATSRQTSLKIKCKKFWQPPLKRRQSTRRIYASKSRKR